MTKREAQLDSGIYGARHISATSGSPAWLRHGRGSPVAELCQAPNIPLGGGWGVGLFMVGG